MCSLINVFLVFLSLSLHFFLIINNRNSKEPDKEKLEAFIRAISNATYENFDLIPDYDGIPAEKYMELLLNLTMSFKPTLTIGAAGIMLEIVPTVTEMGLCYAVNSKVAIYNSPA
jgi:hypothetical protein